MKIRGLVDEDISNYKSTSMFIITSKCNLKCDKENGNNYCQNSSLLRSPIIDVSAENLYQRYINNQFSHAVVIGGLEPFDTFEDLTELLECFRVKHECKDPIIIYTGYTETELNNTFLSLSEYLPLIIKFGRFRPNQDKHLDPILGVELANDEQYAKILFSQEVK